MLVYIVWNKCDRSQASDHIVQISSDRALALSQSDLRDATEIGKVEDALIAEFSSIGCQDFLHCSSIDLSEHAQELTFLKISESGGGGSYHEQVWLYVVESEDEAIEIAETYFDNEHNRENECKKCVNDYCRQKWIRALRMNGSAAIRCTTYEGTSFETWKRKI